MAADSGHDLDAPDDGDAAAVEFGRLLFARECRFVMGAAQLEDIPDAVLPEIAFAGRSNVGKSSLINALTGRRGLARTSRTPGRTQQINFFEFDGTLALVDLPGYGWARVSKHKIRDWTRLMHAYIAGRPTLRRLCLLVDSRHGLMAPDRALIALLDQAGVSYQAVLTKADKPESPSVIEIRADLARELAGHPAAHTGIVTTSARTGAGIETLRAALGALADTKRMG